MDKLGNKINVGDKVVYAMSYGRSAELLFGFVIQTDFKGGLPYAPTAECILVDSNTRQTPMLPRNVIVIPDELQPEKRQEKLHDTEEAVEVSSI